jgi:hypothetical protein
MNNIVVNGVQGGNITINHTAEAAAPENKLVIFQKAWRYNWQGGSIRAFAERKKPSDEKYTIELYIDGMDVIDVFDILNQGEQRGNYQGSGRVNGTVIAEVENDTISFQKIYINSLPGEGGNVQLDLPSENQDATADGFALSLLSGLDYEWIKIELAHIKDKLSDFLPEDDAPENVVQDESSEFSFTVSFNGHPEEPIPYYFDPEKSRFAPIAPGDTTQTPFDSPVNLSVRFSVPFKGASITEVFGLNTELLNTIMSSD